mmetsp:Transcript_32020/g.69797  ORF Transcript_32020/g.69797 Transcript_32020/m.69797 type:complete len:284 (-) Transcript_32020:246-1097(-)
MRGYLEVQGTARVAVLLGFAFGFDEAGCLLLATSGWGGRRLLQTGNLGVPPPALRAAQEDDPVAGTAWQALEALEGPRDIIGRTGRPRALGLQLLLPLQQDVLIGSQLVPGEEDVEEHELRAQQEEDAVHENGAEQEREEEPGRQLPEVGEVLRSPLQGALAQHAVHQEVGRAAQERAGHQKHRAHGREEGAVVRAAHARVQPHAVVVEAVDALLALAAVLARPAHLPLADIAPGSLRTLDALRLEIVLVQQGRVHGIADHRGSGRKHEGHNSSKEGRRYSQA